MGSVKDITVETQPTETETGKGYFDFSDRYSVFDWGEMPDHIPGKGTALALMAAHNFELLEEQDIPTHYRGLVEDGEEKRLDELAGTTDRMSVTLARKPAVEAVNGSYEYEDLTDKPQYLIPLEVIFRNTVPPGSSLRRRATPQEIGLDMEEWPDRTVELDDPVIEFSTKLEEQDRYISEAYAQEISGLMDDEFQQLTERARRINRILTDRAAERGFAHLDGKVEFIYDSGEIVLADVAGTLDENRFAHGDVSLSKELVRDWYRTNDPDWYEEVGAAKQQADEADTVDWKQFVDRTPRPLDPSVLQLVERMYKATTNAWTATRFFDVPALNTVVSRITDHRGEADADDTADTEPVQDDDMDQAETGQHRVVVWMGSIKDEDHITGITETLDEFDVPYDVRALSAHKLPEHVLEDIRDYEGRDESVVYIAVAGKSNALGPMIAANTSQPVINCPPIGSTQEDIYSSLRMPTAVTCSTVLKPKNAALHAIKLFALNDDTLQEQYNDYLTDLKQGLKEDDEQVR